MVIIVNAANIEVNYGGGIAQVIQNASGLDNTPAHNVKNAFNLALQQLNCCKE